MFVLEQMSHTVYNNFVRPISPTQSKVCSIHLSSLNGEEARKLYLEEVNEVTNPKRVTDDKYTKANTDRRNLKRKSHETQISDKDLFVSIENDDIDSLRRVLDSFPDKINLTDNYGWSLLMIACQANSVESVKELLRRGIDTSVRDKAGNSAQSLVIKNKNLTLVNILLDYKSHESHKIKHKDKHRKVKKHEEFVCETCNNKTFPDKQGHLSSTIHNLNASKNKKIPTNYVIPECNRGYQIMLKVGWDRDSGLGRDGSGHKYPIKAVQKNDRKGIGHEKKNVAKSKEDIVRHVNKKTFQADYQINRKMEVNFRRQFY